MALTKVSSSLVKDDAVTSAKIADGGIATADIANNAVTSTKIAQNSILTKHIDDGQVTTSQLGADAVTAAKIADDAISEEHLDITVITSLTEVTAATGDLLMVADISDSNALKKIPVSSILAGTLTTAAQTNITSLGTLTALTVDDITIDGSTISDGGDFTLDVGGDIILDADGGDIWFNDGGTTIGVIKNSSSHLFIESTVQDKDVLIRGNDGGSTITAVEFDMSAAGAATFNAGGTFGGNLAITGHDANITITDNTSSTRAWSIGVGGSADNAFEIKDVTGSNTLLKSTPGSKTVIRPDGNELHLDSSNGNWFKAYESGNDLYIQNKIQDGDIIFGGMDGSSAITALTFDMANGGPATFGNDVYLADSRKIAFGGAADFSIYHDGNVTNILRASGTNHDIHFLVNDDGSANLVALKIDASAAGSITTNHDITMSSGTLVLKNASGDSSGLKLYQGSSDHAYITNNYSGNLEIGTVNNSKKIVLDTSGDLTWNDGAAAFTNSTSPLRFFANSNTGTYNRTVMYAHQNNTSGNMNNGIHFEMGRLTDSSSAEQRAFIVGARGGQSSFKVLDQQAGITQADGDYLVRMYEHNADGFLSLYTGEGAPVERTRITSYGQSWVRSLGVGDGDAARTPPTGAMITIDSAGDNTPLISMIQSNARLASIQCYFSSQAASYIALAPPEGSTDKTAERVFQFHGDGVIKTRCDNGSVYEWFTPVASNAMFAFGGVSPTATSGTGNIHSMHMVQSGKITWGDWTDANALGVCEGTWNQEGTDRDYISFHHRNSMNWYGNSNGQTLSMATGGGMSIKGSLTQNQFSDMRLKRDIVPLESVLDKVNSLDVFNFNYMDPDTGEIDTERNRDAGQIGLSAQQTEELFPQVVEDRERIEGDNTVDNRNWKYLEYEKMTPILVKAVQELTAKVKELEKKLEG